MFGSGASIPAFAGMTKGRLKRHLSISSCCGLPDAPV